MILAVYLCAALGGYLIGCLNTGAILAHIKGFDIRKQGSGNAGASNALLTMGKAAGAVTAFVDILKAYLPVHLVRVYLPALGERLSLSEADTLLLPLTVGVCVILGHMFPFWMQFRGGKGFASLLGFWLAMDWRFLLICLTLLVLLLVTVRYIAIATMVCAALMPVWYGLMDREVIGTVILAVLGLIICLKHIENLRRMKARTEYRIGQKRTELPQTDRSPE